MRRLLAICFLVTLLAPILSPAEAADTATGLSQRVDLPGDFMGMVVRDPHYEWNTNPAFPDDVNRAFLDAMGSNLAQIGVKWVRIEFRAEDSGPFAGRVRLEQYDYFLNEVAPRHGFKVLALLATQLGRWSPEYASAERPLGGYISEELLEADPEDGSCQPFGCGTNTYMRIWLKNAFDIAARFPYNATTGAGIAAYEVMNEENRYLNGGGRGIEPEVMATLLTKFYRLFHQGGLPDQPLGDWRNDVQIILGGIHPGRCDDCRQGARLNDREYLRAIYESPAFTNFRSNNPELGYPLDGVGYHPYPLEIRPELVPEETAVHEIPRIPGRMRAIRQVMLDAGDRDNEIWVTEIGDRGAPQDLDNQRRQADFLRAVYWHLWQQRDFVRNVFWFKYEDFAVPADQQAIGEWNFGVVRVLPRCEPGAAFCEYDPEGRVVVYKQSYYDYGSLSWLGIRTNRVNLPLVIP